MGFTLMRTGVLLSCSREPVIVEVDYRGSGTGGSMMTNTCVLLGGDGGLLSLVFGLSSFSSGGKLTIVGDEAFVSNRGDATMSTGPSVDGSEGVLILVSNSESTTREYMPLISCRGGLDK